jgi:hypothetical protein
MGLDSEPAVAEPLGGLLGLLAALYEPDVRGVYVHGGLISFESLLTSPFCYLPHDMVIPGVIPAGDIPSLAKALGREKVRLEGLVDGLNQQVSKEVLAERYEGIPAVVETSDSAERIAWMLQTAR